MSQESSRLIYCLIRALVRHSIVLFDLAYLMGFSVRRGGVSASPGVLASSPPKAYSGSLDSCHPARFFHNPLGQRHATSPSGDSERRKRRNR